MNNQDRTRFEDSKGQAWDSDEIDELSIFEIERMGIHVAEA